MQRCVRECNLSQREILAEAPSNVKLFFSDYGPMHVAVLVSMLVTDKTISQKVLMHLAPCETFDSRRPTNSPVAPSAVHMTAFFLRIRLPSLGLADIPSVASADVAGQGFFAYA